MIGLDGSLGGSVACAVHHAWLERIVKAKVDYAQYQKAYPVVTRDGVRVFEGEEEYPFTAVWRKLRELGFPGPHRGPISKELLLAFAEAMIAERASSAA